MEINSTSASGIQTFQAAQKRLTESADSIAKAVVEGGSADVTSSLVELKVAEQQATAAAKIIETENNVVGALLDVLA